VSTSQLKQANALSREGKREIEGVKMKLQLTNAEIEKITMDLEGAFEKIASLMIMEGARVINVFLPRHELDNNKHPLAIVDGWSTSWFSHSVSDREVYQDSERQAAIQNTALPDQPRLPKFCKRLYGFHDSICKQFMPSFSSF
jgi:hypothetical protein